MPYFSTVSSSLEQSLAPSVTALQKGFLLKDASRVNELLSLVRYIELTSLYGFLERVSLFLDTSSHTLNSEIVLIVSTMTATFLSFARMLTVMIGTVDNQHSCKTAQGSILFQEKDCVQQDGDHKRRNCQCLTKGRRKG